MQDDPRRLAAAFLQGTAVLALVTLPVGVIAAVLAPELVAVVFGSRWAGLVAPFEVLALGMMFRTCYRMSDSLSRATDKCTGARGARACSPSWFSSARSWDRLGGWWVSRAACSWAFFLNYVSMLMAAWVAPTLALGHDGVRARDMLLGVLPALRKRFLPGGAS